MGLLQNEDHKSEAEIIAAGGAKSQLLNDTKIYVTANGINKTLDDAIIDGNIGGGGGGGGGFLNWNTDSGAPLVVEYGNYGYKFESIANEDGAPFNVCFVKVPNSYNAGFIPQLDFYIYSTSTSGTQLIRTRTYLIRPGTEAIDSTANLYTSANAAAANTGVSKCPQKITVNLADTAGVINSISLAASHLLRIEMYRATDTDTDAVRVLQAMELKFS